MYSDLSGPAEGDLVIVTNPYDHHYGCLGRLTTVWSSLEEAKIEMLQCQKDDDMYVSVWHEFEFKDFKVIDLD